MFRYSFRTYISERIVGIVDTSNYEIAIEKVKNHYSECNDIDWDSLSISAIDFNKDGTRELFFG